MIKSSTSGDILGENADKDLSDPKRWSRDQALRTMKVVVEKQ